MSDSNPNQSTTHAGDAAGHDDVQGYGGGHVQAHHGSINRWLLIVYLIMFVWALYYGYTYWGGLGPGLI